MEAWLGAGRLSTFPTDMAGRAPAVRRSFPRVAESIRDSRVWAREIAISSGDVAYAATVELLVSELTTNAVRYGAGDTFAVEFFKTLLIAVIDAGTAPIFTTPTIPDFGREGGRGLGIVDALAARWGVDVLPGGNRVWFQLGGELTVRDAHG